MYEVYALLDGVQHWPKIELKLQTIA